MKQKYINIRDTIIMSIVALAIPCLLIINGIQSHKYETLLDEVKALEKKQEELVEENKNLVTDISLLSSTERIEKIAEEELGMRKAETDNIVRVEMKGIESGKSNGN